MRFLLVSMLVFSVSTFAQEEDSREFADGVIELTTVKVKTNFLQQYLDGIEQTWVAASKIQQDMGIISNYNVYVGNDGSTVYLTQTYPSWANKAPWTDEQMAEFQEKFSQSISQEENIFNKPSVFSENYNKAQNFNIDGKDFGNLVGNWRGAGGCASSTRGLWCGGRDPSGISNIIQYITIATTGNTTDFGDLTDQRDFPAAGSNSTRGVITGGRTPAICNIIEYITIATLGNATDFGDTFQPIDEHAGTATSIRMFTVGGTDPSVTADVEYVAIATGGTGTDFGDLTAARHHCAAITNAHGGLG